MEYIYKVKNTYDKSMFFHAFCAYYYQNKIIII